MEPFFIFSVVSANPPTKTPSTKILGTVSVGAVISLRRTISSRVNPTFGSVMSTKAYFTFTPSKNSLALGFSSIMNKFYAKSIQTVTLGINVKREYS